MKSKVNNTIEFKPKENNCDKSRKDSLLKDINSNSTCKVIPYSKHKKINHIKSNVNNQVGKFEKQHPKLKKYKPIIILCIIILIISIISSFNNITLNNTYGYNISLNNSKIFYLTNLQTNNLNTFG